MNPIPARNLLLLLSFTSLVAAATNFTQCLENFRANPNATGGVDSHGHDVSAANAVGLSYTTCTEQCGTTAESFSWRQFAQLFSSWLLPWLALISQLPFGSGNYIDDFVSVLMSVGSPALAAYSLMITSFNARMVYRKANRIIHEEKADVAKALVALQQTAIELTTDPRLLESIPVDSKWRREILERLDKRNAWSLATGCSVAWVVIAFTFTIVDSFVSIGDPSGSGSDGLAVGTLWLWLLCLVIGWLWVPIFSSSEVNAALRRANIKAVRTTAKKLKQQTTKMIKHGAYKVADRLNAKVQRRNSKAPKKSDTGFTPTVEFVDENEKVKQGSTDGSETQAGEMPELRSTPSPASFRTPAESQQDHSHLSIGGIHTAQQSTVSIVRSAEAQLPAAASVASLKPGPDRLLIPKEEGGLLHSDEFRHPATFNYSRIMWYLVLVDDVFRALDKLVIADKRKRPFNQVTVPPAQQNTTFPPGVFWTMFRAAVFALLLQVGVTGAAVIIIVFTPTVGLGCRSMGYTAYGGIAIIIMFLTIISTILARISETRKGKSPFVEHATAFFAITLRWICYLLALLNSVGLIALSCFQFSNFLDNCYCNSSALGRGTNTYIVIILQDWVTTMRNFRAIGVSIAAATIFVFMFCLGMISSPPEEMKGI